MSKTGLGLYELVVKNGTVELSTECFTVSDINKIISETPLTKENRLIATKRFADKETVEEIADSLGYDKRTIEVRLKLILIEVIKIAVKIYARRNNLEI